MPEVSRIERLAKRMEKIVTIKATASVADAAKLMKSKHIGCLIVLDGMDIVGIVTERDVVEHVVASSVDPNSVEVSQIMTHHVVSCKMTTPVIEAQRIMAANGIRHLPIIENGKPKGMVSSRDIFALELHDAKAKLAETVKQAEVATRAKTELLSNVSHEIRTPMNAVIGMTELALDTPLTTEQRDCLSIVRNSAEALLGMINDLLDFSHMSIGKIQLQETDFDLRDKIGSIVRSLGRRAESKGLNLTCKILPDVPDRVVGDPGRLSQILVNIISNAVKFTDCGHVDIAVESEECTGEEGVLHFAVADTGIGIPPDKHQVIFEAFQHAENAYKRTHEGLGLGLAISADLIRRMNGDFWLESEVGKGSTFHFTVKLKLQPASKNWEYKSKTPAA